jgi:hypothetical protein
MRVRPRGNVSVCDLNSPNIRYIVRSFRGSCSPYSSTFRLKEEGAMSLLGMPWVVVNLGCEMIYILDQRLKAQGIPQDKCARVLQDIVSCLFDQSFVKDKLFVPQDMYSPQSTRKIFDRLAHSSIMRLSESRWVLPSTDRHYLILRCTVTSWSALLDMPAASCLYTPAYYYSHSVPTHHRSQQVRRQFISPQSFFSEVDVHVLMVTIVCSWHQAVTFQSLFLPLLWAPSEQQHGQAV